MSRVTDSSYPLAGPLDDDDVALVVVDGKVNRATAATLKPWISPSASDASAVAGISATDTMSPAGTAAALGRRPAMVYPGTVGIYVQTPTLHIPTVDFSVVAFGVTPAVSWHPATPQTLWGEYITSGNQRKLALQILDTGIVRAARSLDGTAVANIDSTEALPNNNQELSIALVRDGDTGLGGSIWWFWISKDGGITWRKLGDDKASASVSPLAAVTPPFQVGGLNNNTSQSFAGSIESVEVFSGFGRSGYPIGAPSLGKVSGYTFPQTDANVNGWTKTGAVSAVTLGSLRDGPLRTKYNVREFISGGNIYHDDDWSATFNAGLAHVQGFRGELEAPEMTGFLTAPLTISDGLDFHGKGVGTRLIAATTLADHMVKAQAIGGSAFISGLKIHDLFLDGNGRASNAGGLYLKQVQRSKISDVQCRYLPRGAFYGEAFRNSRVYDVWSRHCADVDQGFADFTLYEPASGSADRCNMLTFYGIESIYPFGRFLNCRSDNNALPIYSAWFVNPQFHGETDATASQTSDGYTFANDVRQYATGVVLQGTQNVRLFIPYFEIAKNGAPYIVTDDNGTGAASNSGVVIDGPQFGNTGHLDLVVTAVDTATDRLSAAANYGLPQCAMVRLTTTGTLPAGLALATDYFVRRVSTTQFTLHTTRYLADSGGAAINITSAGTGTHTVVTQEPAILGYRLAGIRIANPTRTGTPNRKILVDKHGASAGFSGVQGDSTDLYEGPSAVTHDEGIYFTS